MPRGQGTRRASPRVGPVFRKERIKETYRPESHRSSVMPKPPAESLLVVGVNNALNFTRLGSSSHVSLSSDTIALVSNCLRFFCCFFYLGHSVKAQS